MRRFLRSTATSVATVARPLLLALLLSPLLTACLPGPYLSLTPSRQGTDPGSSLVSHPDSVYVRLRFVRAEAQELLFEAEFSNAADHPIAIDPAGFYYLPLPDSLPGSPIRYLARDPEARLAKLIAERDQQAAKAEKIGFFEMLTMLTNTAEDISKIGKKETAAQEAERDERHRSSRLAYDAERAAHAEQAQALHDTATGLASILLRRATLQPGDRAVGLVYFPRLDAARQLRFVLAFDEQPVPFEFDQQLQDPKQP